MTERMFPILQDPQIKCIPWAVLATHEKQALTNHSQTFERLAQRGGLSPAEACAIIADITWSEIRKDVTPAYWRMLLMHRVWEFEQGVRR